MISLQPHLPSNGNWRNTSYMIKIHNCELLQNFTYPEPNSVNSVFCNFVHINFSHFSSLCTSHSFQHESTLHSFFCSLFFFCTSLICFCSFFYILFNHIINHTKFLQLNVIHSSVYIGMLFHLYIFFTMLCVCFPNFAYFTQMLFYNTSQ